MTIDETKAVQRRDALARRDALFSGFRSRASHQACRHLIGVLEDIPRTQAVTAYLASRSEIDPDGAVTWLQDNGTDVGMPVVTAKAHPLVFRRFRKGDSLIAGTFGIPVPPMTAPYVLPSVFVVPLAAFDRRGYRIGYGGGFYDRTLQAARQSRKVLAVGFAFACQEIDDVVRDHYDQPLDLIVTETGVLSCR